eukprot:4390833-Amphidinium_carterae.1
MQKEIEQIRQQFRSKRVALELQIGTLAEQYSAAAESMQELKEQQTRLVAEGPAEPELDTFRKVLATLADKDPVHKQLFEEVDAFARRELKTEVQRPARTPGAGPWNAQTEAPEDAHMDTEVVPDNGDTLVHGIELGGTVPAKVTGPVPSVTPVEPGQKLLPCIRQVRGRTVDEEETGRRTSRTPRRGEEQSG